MFKRIFRSSSKYSTFSWILGLKYQGFTVWLLASYNWETGVFPVHNLSTYDQEYYHDQWHYLGQILLSVIDFFILFFCIFRHHVDHVEFLLPLGISRLFYCWMRKEIKRELQYFSKPSTLKKTFILAFKIKTRLSCLKKVIYENVEVEKSLTEQGQFKSKDQKARTVD